MDPIIADFGRAIITQDGYALATTISPVPPKHDSGRLYALRRATNPYNVLNDFRYAIGQNPNFSLDRQEANCWVDVYVAYWKAISNILAAEESSNLAKNSSISSGALWDKVYSSWKDLLNALCKGYQKSSFEAWTIPCLYMTAKYLRIFAVKADASASAIHSNQNVSFSATLDDDLVDEEAGNEKLEDCARQINRIFALCSTDRSIFIRVNSACPRVSDFRQSSLGRVSQMGTVLH